MSVSTAGDVNGDGYSDVIVGAPNFDNGQTDEGRAFVYHGSSTGLSPSANWTAESNHASSSFGMSVASAGDVNGDGYSDVIVGANRFTNGEANEGRAFLYYGNGSDGRRTNVQQYRPATSTVVGSGGLTTVNGGVKLSMFGKSPFGRTEGKIAHEYKSNGVAFSGGVITNWTGVTGTGNFTDLGLAGAEVVHDIAGLQTGKLYKWRARMQYDLAANPYQKYGPWKYYNNYMPAPHGNFRPSNGTTLNNILNLTMLIQGFYNSTSNVTIQDTVKVYIRNSTSPFAVIDSSKGYLSTAGQAAVVFSNVSNGVNYYIEVRHRNSIKTWSKTVPTFSGSIMNYDFTTLANKAFGDNMFQVDFAPTEFAIYSGDVNQDDIADAGDLSQVENDAASSLSGYVISDITGDDFVDAGDVSIVENNVALGINVITP